MCKDNGKRRDAPTKPACNGLYNKTLTPWDSLSAIENRLTKKTKIVSSAQEHESRQRTPVIKEKHKLTVWSKIVASPVTVSDPRRLEIEIFIALLDTVVFARTNEAWGA